MEKFVHLYRGGLSIPQISEKTGAARSTVRYHLKKAGVLRSRAEGVRAAASSGRLGGGLRGKSRVFTQDHKDNISKGRIAWSAENAKGVSLKPNGYLEHTTGEEKGKSVHVARMEERLGRALLTDECVHHIDGDKLNNDDNNLALMTRSGHSRLHRREDALQGKYRERNPNGRFS
jgi:hypothetical protein